MGKKKILKMKMKKKKEKVGENGVMKTPNKEIVREEKKVRHRNWKYFSKNIKT